MNFIEYLNILRKKYNITNSEILVELKNNGINITPGNLTHKLKGERMFSEKEFSIIMNTVRPTVAESGKLVELYNIFRFGEDRFQEVMYIKDYIEDLSDETVVSFDCSLNSLDGISKIDGEQKISEVISFMLRQSWDLDVIRIFCQPDFKNLINQLIFFSRKSSSDIEYLVCMNNDCGSDNNLYNINVLRCLGKVAKYNFNCNVKYFYDNINSRVNDFTFLPFYIICGKYVLFLSYDFKSAYLSTDKVLNEMALSRFTAIFEKSRKLFRFADNVEEYMSICTQFELSCKEKFYTLQFHPCVLYVGDKSLIDDHLKEIFPMKSAFLNEINRRSSNNGITGYNFHSSKGTQDFINTGFTSDMSPLHCLPYSNIERKQILEKLKSVKHHVSIEMKTDFVSLPKEMFVGCYDNGNVVISYKSKQNECARLIINERGLYKSVSNFFEYIYNYCRG